MKSYLQRGELLPWRNAAVISLLIQFVVYLGVKDDGFYRRANADHLIWMYFLVPILSGMIWRSWKIFFIAVAFPILLIVVETSYYLLKQMLSS